MRSAESDIGLVQCSADDYRSISISTKRMESIVKSQVDPVIGTISSQYIPHILPCQVEMGSSLGLLPGFQCLDCRLPNFHAGIG